jgi:hypothetical protein
LQNVKSPSAKVGEKLRTQHFNTGTIGFAAPEDAHTAVCVLPGTELAFATAIRRNRLRWFGWKVRVVNHTTAIFRQIDKDNPRTHHDALEFPDGRMVLLTDLLGGQEATSFSFWRNLLQRRKSKPKNGFRIFDLFPLGHLHTEAASVFGWTYCSLVEVLGTTATRKQCGSVQ